MARQKWNTKHESVSRATLSASPAMVSLHFCSECNNWLYPKADQRRRIMVYACRICTYDEIGENKCVHRNDLLTVTKCVCGHLACYDLLILSYVESRSG
ncbi:hypothetical protein C8R43DRAFT_1046106 [Mycena crocata]|nr:hypothetical protein C8R43DRAFT_1046106 [Mycena crocata]